VVVLLVCCGGALWAASNLDIQVNELDSIRRELGMWMMSGWRA